MNNNKNNQLLLSIIGIAILCIAVVGVTFAFFSYTKTGSNNVVQAGRIVFNITEGEAINLSNAFPITSTQAQTDTTNAKTLAVTVTGDTSYSGGIEYLVTATDVHMTTTTGKTVPVTIEVSIAGNNSKTLGTSDEDYYTNRGGNTSMYKIEYDGELNNNDHILVGYIAPDTTETGVDGIINIKAYFNDADILISDTYNDGNPPTDEKGTPVSLGEGKTVLTTTEWNSLQTNGLSFKIKVEAREGIWVEEPVTNTGTIDSCPNCKFIYPTESMLTTWTTLSLPPTELTSGYSYNYNDIVSSSGKNYFLGVITNGSNQITRAFACGLKDNTTPFCIEGDADGSKYSANLEFLNGPTLWNNTCTVDTDDEEGDTYTKCGSWDGSSVSARVSYSSVSAGVRDDANCAVNRFGNLLCVRPIG